MFLTNIDRKTRIWFAEYQLFYGFKTSVPGYLFGKKLMVATLTKHTNFFLTENGLVCNKIANTPLFIAELIHGH